MRIVSPFHDYYDVAQGHGHDASRVFVRAPQAHPAAFGRASVALPGVPPELMWAQEIAKLVPPPRHFRDKKGVEQTVTGGWILFAGKLYPLADVVAPGQPSPRVIYSHEELVALVGGAAPKKSAFLSRAYSDSLTWKDFFDLSASPRWVSLALEHHVAVLCWLQATCLLYQNVPLKPLQFYQRLDAWQAYQELDMFLGNLASPEKPVPLIDDRYRLEQHGFDKWSFRRPPAR